jgi:hypothetical protein
MQAFIVEASNRPGEFARHCSLPAARGVNLYALCLGLGDRGGAAFMSQDEAGLRSAFDDAGVAFREIPVLTIAMDDRPGTAAAAAQRLADAGVNIDLFVPVGIRDGKATIAVGVDKIEDARRVLSDQLTEWTAPATAGAR